MDKLIEHFSVKSLTDFFFNKVSAFQKVTENMDYILDDKNFINFSELQKVGEVPFNNSDELIVFACKFQGVLSERSSKKRQFEIAKKVLKEDFKDGAIFIFYDANGFFRFSFIRKNYGNKNQKFTTWKRYTFFVDPTKTNKTFRNRINGCNFSSLDDIQEAFNVEKLTTQFYNELFSWYQWSLSESDGFEVTYPNDISTDKDDRQIEEHLIRLITRLMFIWFIKKKKLIPDSIFNTTVLDKILADFDPNSKSNGDYYNAILQNLFFASLNKPIDERTFATGKNYQGKDEHYGIKTLFRDNNDKSWFKEKPAEIIDLFKNVPFLNGGLFECLDKENDNGKIFYYDGFSRLSGRQKRAFLPNCIFFDTDKGIIPLLERYNFTIEENSTDDIEVALDPELLGKVFENLLGAYNPETKETARKQSGSFYTPREIVDYMVNESVIQYLKKECPTVPEATWSKLFNTDEIPETLTDNDCKKITASLRNIKILDPACGSGAFPMGVLNTLIKILKKVDTQNTLSNYDIKLELIENCIYGVDIQSIAVQISKLRFFISLVCEQETTTDVATNYGIKSLPNLETKFVAANTLIGLKQDAKSMIEWQDETLFELKNQLWDIRCHQNFRAQKWQEKKLLRQKDKELCEKIETYLKTIATKPNLALIDDYNKQLASQELEIKNLPVIWADVTETAMQTTMFENVTNQTQSLFKIDINKEKREQLKKSNKLLLKKIEQEKSKQHLADTSEALSLIEWNPYDQNTSSSFFDPEWMFGIPDFDIVIGNPPYVDIKALPKDDVKEYFKIFLTTENRINLYAIFIEKGKLLLKSNGILCYINPNSILINQSYRKIRKFIINDIEKIVKLPDSVFTTASVETIILMLNNNSKKNYIEGAYFLNDEKIDFNNLNYKLFERKKWKEDKDVRFNIFSNETTRELISKIEFNSDKLEKFVWTSLGITPYDKAKGHSESLINNREFHSNEKISNEYVALISGKNIEKYYLKNDIKEYLKYGNWLGAPREKKFFTRPKIIVRQILGGKEQQIFSTFTDEPKFFTQIGFSLISKTENSEELKFILSLLNSKLLTFYHRNKFLDIEKVLFQKILIVNCKQLPIKYISFENQQPFINLVNQILSSKKENGDTTDLEKQIDVMVYKLYELDYEEVLIVEPEFMLSKKEYETF